MRQSSVFGGNIIPSLKDAIITEDMGHAGPTVGYSVIGFPGDLAHRVWLPTSGGSSLRYRSETDVEEWNIAGAAAVIAGYDDWSAFMMDAVDDLIYGAVTETGATPDTIGIFSIDQAGTLTNIGSAAFASQPVSTADWAAPNCTIQRSADGVGNLTMIIGGTTYIQEVVIDITDGSMVSGPTEVAEAGSKQAWYKSAGDIYASFTGDADTKTTFLHLAYADNAIKEIVLPPGTMVPNFGVVDAIPIQWRGNIAIVAANGTSAVNGARYFDKTLFEEWITRMANIAGL